MADKQTETWWQQLMGLGLVEELADVELDVIPSILQRRNSYKFLTLVHINQLNRYL